MEQPNIKPSSLASTCSIRSRCMCITTPATMCRLGSWTTDYNGLCFHVSQAFFPRTSAWDSLKKALRGIYDETVWDHLAGTTSAPFEAGEHGQIAVKVIDDRGNELMVVKELKEST
jgi:hypothetical protein